MEVKEISRERLYDIISECLEPLLEAINLYYSITAQRIVQDAVRILNDDTYCAHVLSNFKNFNQRSSNFFICEFASFSIESNFLPYSINETNKTKLLGLPKRKISVDIFCELSKRVGTVLKESCLTDGFSTTDQLSETFIEEINNKLRDFTQAKQKEINALTEQLRNAEALMNNEIHQRLVEKSNAERWQRRCDQLEATVGDINAKNERIKSLDRQLQLLMKKNDQLSFQTKETHLALKQLEDEKEQMSKLLTEWQNRSEYSKQLEEENKKLKEERERYKNSPEYQEEIAEIKKKRVQISRIKEGILSKAKQFDSKKDLRSFLQDIGDVLRGTAWDEIYSNVMNEAYAIFDECNKPLSPVSMPNAQYANIFESQGTAIHKVEEYNSDSKKNNDQ